MSYQRNFYENDEDFGRQVHYFINGQWVGTDVLDFRHGYDASARLVSEYTNKSDWMWSAGGIKTTSCALNDLDQYTGEDGSGAMLSMSYDGRGNMITHSARNYFHDSENRMSVKETNRTQEEHIPMSSLLGK